MTIFGGKDNIPAAQRGNVLVAVQGPGGSGKTSLTRRLVEANYKVAHLDVDGGAKSIEDLIDGDRVIYAAAEDFTQFKPAWKEIVKLPPEYVVVVDTFSTILDWHAIDLGLTTAKFSFSEYGVIGRMGIALLMQMKRRELGHHVILLCHETWELDEDKRMWYVPRLQGQMTSRMFSTSFDGVFRCYVAGERGAAPSFLIQTAPTYNVETKLRVTPAMREKIPPVIPHQQFGQVFRVLTGAA